MVTISEETQDNQDKEKNDTVEIVTDDFLQKLFVKFRIGVAVEREEDMELIDELRSDLAGEMMLAITKVVEANRNKDGTRKYADITVIPEFKISYEMVEWIQV